LVRFSRRINQAISTKFSIHGLGQLIYRTRLKIAAQMLGFTEYGDFADYFGPRWNYLLKNDIAWVPVPFHFLKGDFESGVASVVLAEYAEQPEKYLDARGKKKMGDVSWNLWRLLREVLDEDDTEERLERQFMRFGDNVVDGPLTRDDLQDALFHGSENPF
jgi:hypothetical protein